MTGGFAEGEVAQIPHYPAGWLSGWISPPYRILVRYGGLHIHACVYHGSTRCRSLYGDLAYVDIAAE